MKLTIEEDQVTELGDTVLIYKAVGAKKKYYFGSDQGTVFPPARLSHSVQTIKLANDIGHVLIKDYHTPSFSNCGRAACDPLAGGMDIISAQLKINESFTSFTCHKSFNLL